MAFGVIFYSMVVGTLTSVITEEVYDEQSLTLKLKALDQFSDENKLDPVLHKHLTSFLVQNYNELFARIDEDAMLGELPSTLKEEVLFHQYGSIIKRFEFFTKMTNNQFVWATVKKLAKLAYDKNENIYIDNSISDCMYFIHKGQIKLYAENDYPFQACKMGE